MTKLQTLTVTAESEAYETTQKGKMLEDSGTPISDVKKAELIDLKAHVLMTVAKIFYFPRPTQKPARSTAASAPAISPV
jgi:hypothetical protein